MACRGGPIEVIQAMLMRVGGQLIGARLMCYAKRSMAASALRAKAKSLSW
jgi:hypothetical protein